MALERFLAPRSQAAARQTEGSRAEAAEAQLHALREESAANLRAHDVEVQALKAAHRDEVATLRRAHAAELTALERASVHSRQVGGLAEQVGTAVEAISKLQRDASAQQSSTQQSLSSYHDKRSAALAEQVLPHTVCPCPAPRRRLLTASNHLSPTACPSLPAPCLPPTSWQEARVAEAQRAAYDERASLQALTTALQASMRQLAASRHANPRWP